MINNYNWDKLVDRCQVYVDGSRRALRLFLQEAEAELTRKVNIIESNISFVPYEGEYWYDLTGSSANNFKEMKAIFYKGHKLKRINEEELLLDNYNSSEFGTPEKYYLTSNVVSTLPNVRIYFDKIPPFQPVGFRMWYYAIAEPNEVGPQIPAPFHTDLCFYAIAQVSSKSNPDMFNS